MNFLHVSAGWADIDAGVEWKEMVFHEAMVFMSHCQPYAHFFTLF
jgi:hypothetical protein